MSRIAALLLLLAVAFGAALVAGCTSSTPPPQPKTWPRPSFQPQPLDVSQLALSHPGCNIVLVSFDALQAAHVGCLGYDRDTTPNLDDFAERSFVFSRAYSASSWTVPASMTWFTGVYPSQHRLTNKFAVYSRERQQPAKLRELSPELTTLAEVLQQNGYATAGFTGNAGVSGSFGFDQGFDVYQHDKQRFGSVGDSIARALEWLRAHRDEKFFLFLHGYDVHGQSAPAGGYDYRFVEPGYDRKFTGAPQEQELLREEGLDKGQLTLRDADVRFWRAIYDEKIQRADAKFGQFLAEFDKLGLADRTLFVLTSDHGTEFYEHRRLDHGFTLYEELIRVPLVIRLPGQSGGTVIGEPASSIDLMPTILDLAAADVPDKVRQQMRGRGLAPLLRGQPTSRDIVCETDYRQYTYKRALITRDGWKLIFTLENKSRELFDLTRDPGETHNRLADRPQLAAELENRLIAHYRELGHDFTAERWEVGLNPVYDSQAPKP